MKKINAALLILGIIGSANSFATNVCERGAATLRCGSGAVETIDFRGFVDIDGTTVSKSLDVVGNVDAQKARLNHVRVRGNTYLDMTTATSSMDITGNVRANDLTILGLAKIVGYFHGRRATFHSTASIVGTLDCESCNFNDDVTFVGDIKASNTNFLGKILLNANKSQFYHSTMNDIAVKKPSENQDQIIELSDGSIANNIVFESGTGLVILSGNSKVKGKVQGGKVITKPA